jgi:hypothetical protein
LDYLLLPPIMPYICDDRMNQHLVAATLHIVYL